MKSDSTTVIKNMEFLVKELHKEWDRSGASKASVIISLEEVDGINDKLKEIIYQTQKSVDEDELTFKQSIAKSKECYVLLRVVRKIAKKMDRAMIMQLNLLPVARKMVLEELEMKQNG